MPTLVRLVVVLGAFAAIVFGAMTALVTYMKPEPRPITQVIKIPSVRR